MSWNTLPPHIQQIARDELSPRQLDVLKLMLCDYGYKRIAMALGISPSTARNHIERVRQKLGPHLRNAPSN